MSDYHYYLVEKEPGRPKVGPLLFLLSWFMPVVGWTEGTGVRTKYKGTITARREWKVYRGFASHIGIDHLCGDTKTCRCVTSRQFRS